MRTEKTIIDGNSIGYLSNQIGPKLKAGDQETQAVFYSIRTLRDIVQRYKATGVLIVWDGRSWRHGVYPEYKANRTATEKQRVVREAYKSQKPFLQRALTALGITQAMATNLEADDLAAVLTERYAGKGEKVRLITRDHDWLQLIRKDVAWIDHQTNERVSLAKFQEFTGVETPEQFVAIKALQGDAGDNIKGVGGIGEVKAKQMLEIWGSVEEFLADHAPDKTFNERTGKNIHKALRDFHTDPARQEAYRFNLRLVNIRDISVIPKIDKLNIVRGKYDPLAFKEVCKELGFHSILNDFDGFVIAFRPTGEI